MGSWPKPAERRLLRLDPQPDLGNANVGMSEENFRDALRISFFCNSDEPKSGLVRTLGDRLQSRDVPFDTSDDCICTAVRQTGDSTLCRNKKIWLKSI